jgi:hypothetical protein
MANTKISAFSAASALTGTEELGGVQSAANAKITPAQIKTYCNTPVTLGPLYWPAPQLSPGPITYGGAAQSNTFNATNDQIAGVFQANFSDSISKIYMRVGALTTAATMKMGVYAIGTDGKPALTPTLWSANGTGADPSGNLLISGANTWQTFTLTNAAVMVPGNKFAIVLSYVSGSAPNFVVQSAASATSGQLGQDQLQLISDAGAAYAAAVQSPFLWIIELTSGGVIALSGVLPIDGAATLTAFNTGTVDERGMRFTAPARMRAVGLRIGLANLTAASAFTASLWDDTTDGPNAQVPLAQAPSIDGDGTFSATQDGYFDAYFTTPYTLAAGTTYRAGVRNTTANAISLIEFTTPAGITNAIRGCGVGTYLGYLCTRTWSGTDPGAWTNTTTTFPNISLIVDQVIG